MRTHMDIDRRLRKEAKDIEQIKEWRNQLATMFQAVGGLYSDRMVARRVISFVQANPKLERDNLLFGWMMRNYHQQAAAAVRRLVELDEKNRPVTLAHIARRICVNAHVLNRDRFIVEYAKGICEERLYPWPHPVLTVTLGEPIYLDMGPELYEHRIKQIVEAANELFDQYSGPRGNYVDPSIIDKRLQNVYRLSCSVSDWVDKHIAHCDKKRAEFKLTYGELDKAIDAVGSLYCWLSRLLTGHAPQDSDMEPVPQFNWEWVFYEPWARLDQEDPEPIP